MSLFTEDATTPLVSAGDLALAYGGRRVLERVNLRIMAGEAWFVVGPNGAGKSTLLKALLGLIEPADGAIGVARALDDRSRIGVVPQRIELPASVPTTVREFVDLGFAGLALPAAERHRRLVLALARVGLEGRQRQAMGELSGGQRQRAAIARALVRDPLLLVLDEPTTGLDLVAERDLLALIRDLNRERALTVVFVAHDLQTVADHASHIALVAGGTVVAGPAADILTSELLTTAFGCPILVDEIAGRRSVRTA